MRNPAESSKNVLRPRSVIGLILLATALLVSGCGSSEDDSGAGSNDPVTITDALGTEITLERPAERIVSTEWESTENLIALGVPPVGAGDTDIYRDWVAAGEPVPEETVNVGLRSEPSLEKIASLSPDLIVVPRDLPEESRNQIARLAPTAVFDPYPEPGPDAPSEFEMMSFEVEALGVLTGTEERAAQLLDDLEVAIAEQRERIEEAGASGDSIVLAQGFTSGKPVTRLFDDGSAMVEVAEQMTLENAFEAEKETYSFTEVGLEGLRQIEDADWLLTMAQEDDDPFADAWSGNPAYDGLSVVERDRVKSIGGDTWTWGGPLSLALLAERIADAIVGGRTG